jgi:anti-sigma B factor antagonist
VTLKITTRDQDGVAVITCSGRVVFGDEATMLRDEVKKTLAQNKNIVINLGGVSYIDSGGLGTLVSLYTSAKAAGGDIRLANLTQRVGDLLQITKLLTVFETFEGESNAIASYKQKASA